MIRDDREISTADFLKETGGLTLEEYQRKLEAQAENLRAVERSSSRSGDGPEPLFTTDRQRGYYGRQSGAYGDGARTGGQSDVYGRQARPSAQGRGGAQAPRGSDTGKYTKGYYDGYADAIDEIEERLAAEEEDEYDFGRHYSGKGGRRPVKPKPRRQVIYEYEEPVIKYKRKRRHPFLRFLLVLLIIAAVLIGFVSVTLLSKVDHIDPVADTAADDHAAAMGIPLDKSPAMKNILLIGSDKRGTEEERQRSDTMIICSINSKTGKIALTSLMRDMYVPIPGYGYNKLNAAYALGDVELLDETIQEGFGVDINGNVLVDFDSFIQTLTSVGNIDIELTQEEADYLNSGGWEDQGDAVNDGSWNLSAGMNSLTPAQSLAYCRIRYVGNSDWERTERQRRVIMAAASKFKHSDPLTQYRVISGVLGHVTTDMTNTALLSAMFRALLASGGDMKTNLIPVEGTYYPDMIDGMAVLVPDMGQNSAYLKEYINGQG